MTSAKGLARGGALACVAFAALPGYYAATLDWYPHTDFDILGMLWALQNIPRLTAFGLSAGLAAMALYFWHRSNQL